MENSGWVKPSAIASANGRVTSAVNQHSMEMKASSERPAYMPKCEVRSAANPTRAIHGNIQTSASALRKKISSCGGMMRVR